MRPLPNEIRYSFRRLAKAHWFAVTTILTLAFGIGACSTVFSLIEGILLRPLPFRSPARLVQLGEHLGNNPGIGVTARDIDVYSKATSAFSSVGGSTGTTFELTGGSVPQIVSAARLTYGVFPTLGVEPLIGRTFTQQEDLAHIPVAILSYALWTDRYHRDPHILGSSIELDRKVYTIIGVMPRNFEFPIQVGRLNQAQLWVPMSLIPEELSEQAAGVWGFQMVARMKDGMTVREAKEDANRVSQEIMRSYPATMSNIQIRGDAKPLSEIVTGNVAALLRILFIAASVVLLIACTNVAILMLVRAIRNHRDHAVRLALGAGSGTILRETVVEGTLLSVAGGVIGLAGAGIAIRVALHLWADEIPRADSISIDAAVALFTFGVALLTGLASSVAPSFVALRTNLMLSLKNATGVGTRSHARLRSALAITEIAIALLLLTVAGAFLRSYQKMLAVDPGFRPEHVLVAGYELPATKYPTDETIEAFNRTVIERLSSKPGITTAGIGNTLPSSGDSGMAAYTVEGERSDGWKLKSAGFGAIYGNYFATLGIPLLAGRTFTQNDRPNSPLVVVISQSMARHSWPGESVIGKRIHVGNPKKGLPWATVVGVVGNTRIGPRDQEGNDQWYYPAQQPAILHGFQLSGVRIVPAGGFIVLRSTLLPEQMIGVLQESVRRIDPLLALDQVQSMSNVQSRTESPRRLMTELIGGFALSAILLSVTGIYAVMSFAVSQRTQEIAIRMALGARRNNVTKLILHYGTWMALAGCGIGIVGSLAAARYVQSFLFEVTAADPWVYFVCVVLMVLFAIVASIVPAARAASVDPVAAMRCDQ